MGRRRKVDPADAEKEREEAAKRQQTETNEEVIDVDETQEEEDDYESEESDEHEGFVLAPDSVSKYIITRYTSNMEGKNIPWKWIVTSENNRFTTRTK
jgi:hypothetical protein